jgi:hypothetical protein
MRRNAEGKSTSEMVNKLQAEILVAKEKKDALLDELRVSKEANVIINKYLKSDPDYRNTSKIPTPDAMKILNASEFPREDMSKYIKMIVKESTIRDKPEEMNEIGKSGLNEESLMNIDVGDDDDDDEKEEILKTKDPNLEAEDVAERQIWDRYVGYPIYLGIFGIEELDRFYEDDQQPYKGAIKKYNHDPISFEQAYPDEMNSMLYTEVLNRIKDPNIWNFVLDSFKGVVNNMFDSGNENPLNGLLKYAKDYPGSSIESHIWNSLAQIMNELGRDFFDSDPSYEDILEAIGNAYGASLRNTVMGKVERFEGDYGEGGNT